MDDKKQENNKNAIKNCENLNENTKNDKSCSENEQLLKTQIANSVNDLNAITTKTHREKRKIAPNSDYQIAAEHSELPSPNTVASGDTDEQTSTEEEDFEPTIDMLVNDFDDEQTLNEEEEIAAQEMLDPQQEIDTLKQEGEMPLEKLLAMYGPIGGYCAAESVPSPRKKIKKSNSISRKVKFKAERATADSTTAVAVADAVNYSETATNKNGKLTDDVAVNGDVKDSVAIANSPLTRESELVQPNDLEFENEDEDDEDYADRSVGNEENMIEEQFVKPAVENRKARRTHLIELYPEENFATVVSGDESRDDEAEDEAEEDETDYAKKAVMVGQAYQAVIPVGLSQYGDVLPYENEDKLVWEPSQVSEQEVEEYLLAAENKTADNDNTGTGVVKDDEQALHLLVQCGYDFKEALRRKQLNAMPLSSAMSLWSEEECQKFEEGIQKYGKDFLKIRQNQVRTRTMRELVHFYYLWKKSHRRDQSFPNSDTIDQMDVFLNESGDYNTNNIPIIPTNVSNHQFNSMAKTTQQKQFSIMTGNCTAATANANAAVAVANENANIINTTTAPTTNGSSSRGVITSPAVNKTNARKRSSSISATAGSTLNTQNNKGEI